MASSSSSLPPFGSVFVVTRFKWLLVLSVARTHSLPPDCQSINKAKSSRSQYIGAVFAVPEKSTLALEDPIQTTNITISITQLERFDGGWGLSGNLSPDPFRRQTATTPSNEANARCWQGKEKRELREERRRESYQQRDGNGRGGHLHFVMDGSTLRLFHFSPSFPPPQCPSFPPSAPLESRRHRLTARRLHRLLYFL